LEKPATAATLVSAPARGYATLGQIGFSEHSGYTAIGTVCNLAARLCAEAKDGQILVSSHIAEAVEAVARLEDLGNLELKSKPAASGDCRPELERRQGQSETNVTTEPWSAVEWIAPPPPGHRSIGIRFHNAEIRPVRAKFAAEQFHARIAPNNAMTLSRIEWL